jgi:hypothetical protein
MANLGLRRRVVVVVVVEEGGAGYWVDFAVCESSRLQSTADGRKRAARRGAVPAGIET